MVTRSERLDEFITDRLPEPGQHVKVLAEDHVGTYAIPFSCEHKGGSWRNAVSGEALKANIIGWIEIETGRRDGIAPTV
jgi:hypothetical protein